MTRSRNVSVDFSKHRVYSTGLISDDELYCLLKLASIGNGNILEIGCHTGNTTRALAEAFPDKLIYAIDCVKTPPAIDKEQIHETPDWNSVCQEARDLTNVIYINCPSAHLQIPHKISTIFIDGGHDYYTCSQDTRKAYAYNPDVIVWHDVLKNLTAPWIRVYEVLTEYPRINYINHTRLAFHLSNEHTSPLSIFRESHLL